MPKSTQNMRTAFKVALALSGLLTISCKKQASQKTADGEVRAIIPKGELGPAENFTKAWNYGLVANDTTYNTLVGKYILNQVPGAIGIHIQPVRY
jgi:hypothetical protein